MKELTVCLLNVKGIGDILKRREFKPEHGRKIKIKKLAENWSWRKLMIFGKVTIIKSLLTSQLVYILIPLWTCSEAMKETNELLYKFLWDGK